MDAASQRQREDRDERRGSLRRLDDLLEVLESLNLAERTVVPEPVLERLREVGIATPEALSVAGLIERVWDVQTQYLVVVPVERRHYRRRRPREGASAEPWLPTGN